MYFVKVIRKSKGLWSLRAIITESLTDIAPDDVEENASDATADNTRYELNDNDQEREIGVVSGGKRKRGRCSQCDQVTKKFAIHAKIATLLYALTTAT